VVWAVDFQFDATTDGRPIKIVSIVDEHTRECLGGLVERNITGRHLIDELDRLAVGRGYPAVLRCDNGPELACAAMADWAGRDSAMLRIESGQDHFRLERQPELGSGNCENAVRRSRQSSLACPGS